MKSDSTIAHSATKDFAVLLLAAGVNAADVSDALVSIGLAVMASERPEAALDVAEAYAEALDGR
jgi:hypothetical protein